MSKTTKIMRCNCEVNNNDCNVVKTKFSCNKVEKRCTCDECGGYLPRVFGISASISKEHEAELDKQAQMRGIKDQLRSLGLHF